MSTQQEIRRLTAPGIRARKGGEPVVCLTSYHAHTARLVDRFCDVILVGDSLGMVVLGYPDTLSVTVDDMLHHTRAAVRGTSHALVVGDMPYLSYHVSVEESVRKSLEGRAQVIEQVQVRKALPANWVLHSRAGEVVLT